MDKPFLLVYSSSVNRSPVKLRRDCLTAHFGCLLGPPMLPPVDVILAEFAGLHPEKMAEWRRCVAEELLLRQACGVRNPEDWLVEFADVSPFGPDHPVTLSDCLDRRCACAIFPLAGGEAVGLGHVWVVEGVEYRDGRPEVEIIPPGFGVYFVASVASHEWSGSSWQLAGAMALAALDRASGIATPSELLDWVFTGEVRDDRLVKIGSVAGKGKLPMPGKRWLLPRENAVEEELKDLRRTLRMVYTESSLRSAVALVSEHGTRSHQRDVDRIECDEMHALVGGAPEPVIAGFLLATADNLTLWHSEKTRGTADLIKTVVESILPDSRVTLEPMPSDSVAKAERCLWKPLAARADRRIAVNVTGGNRLMSFAAHTMAKLFDNIKLIYRDTDASKHEFLEIVYRQDNPSEATLSCKPHRAADLDWAVLYSNNSELRLGADDILARMKCNPCGTPGQSDPIDA